MFKSIRSKIILSYILLIIVAMLVTGLFLQWSMKQILERELINQLQSQCETYADFIHSRTSGPEDFVARSREVVSEFVSDKNHFIRVYDFQGSLAAESGERIYPYMLVPADILDERGFLQELKFYDASGKTPIWELLDVESIIALDSWDIQEPPSEELLRLVLNRLNKMMSDSYLFDVSWFDLVSSPSQKEDLLNRGLENLSQMEIEKLNRRVLETLFEGMIKKAEEPSLLPAYVIESLTKGERVHWFETRNGGRMLHVAAPIRLVRLWGEEYAGITDLASPLAQIDSTYKSLSTHLMLAITLSVFLTLLISLILAETLTKPILRIRDMAERIAQGDLTKRVDYAGRDEISSLVLTINHMAEQIQANIDEITGEKDKMNALLSALPDGVIALDHEANVLFLNEAAIKMTKIEPDNASGSNLLTLWNEEEISRFLKDSAESDIVYTREISLPPLILKLYMVPFGDKQKQVSGNMLVIRDITDLRRLEETRTQFFGSISHELRTPLTIIKGWIHTIIDEEPIVKSEHINKALKIMDEETDRLTRLVNELLELSRLRSKKLSFEMETVRVNEIVAETVEQISNNAQRMNIALIKEIDPKETEIQADKDRLKQVIINLIDNAVKYTPSGGRVIIKTKQQEDQWVFEVEDTGMGISRDELPFLFERFYRTKDRKKKQFIKGTGLGMAIVKEIVDAHQGVINVESQEEKGTKIHIALPLK